jgi:hypothetical protein
MTDNMHPDAERLQEEFRELMNRNPEMGSMTLMKELPERPRGILSTADREYLVGQREYEHPQSEANRKQDIRKRTVNAILDFALLAEHLPDEEREKVFNELYSEDELPDPSSSIISFLYRGLDGDLERLESIVEEGIYIGANSKKIGRWSGEIADINTSIDVEQRPDRSEVIKKFEQGDADQLTPVEIGVLVRTGQLNEDDLRDLERTVTPRPIGTEELLEDLDDEDEELVRSGDAEIVLDSDMTESPSDEKNPEGSK